MIKRPHKIDTILGALFANTIDKRNPDFGPLVPNYIYTDLWDAESKIFILCRYKSEIEILP